MLPVKPSVTTTSAAPRSRSRASALPSKSDPVGLAQQLVRLDRELVALLRLLADREQPHLGLGDVEDLRRRRPSPSPRTGRGARAGSRRSRRRRAAARRRFGSGSGSRSRAAGRRAGGAGGAGRRRASRRCSRPRRPRRRSPSATARTALTSEESGFARTASAGFSAMPIAVCGDDELEPARVEARGAVQRRPRCPSAAAASAPATISSGARSPPSASTATRVTALAGEAERLDLAALVGAAGRADAVSELRRAALRAGVHPRRLERVRRPALVAPGLRGFPLRDSHERRTA